MDVEGPSHAAANARRGGEVVVAAHATLIVGVREAHHVALAVVVRVHAAQRRCADDRACANAA